MRQWNAFRPPRRACRVKDRGMVVRLRARKLSRFGREQPTPASFVGVVGIEENEVRAAIEPQLVETVDLLADREHAPASAVAHVMREVVATRLGIDRYDDGARIENRERGDDPLRTVRREEQD